MNEMKGRVLLKILQKHGFCNKANTSRYVGLIRDNLNGCKLERNLLTLSLNANIPHELISEIKLNLTGEWSPYNSNYNPTSLKTKFIEKLKIKFWLTEEASVWVVQTWIKAIFDSLPYEDNSTSIPMVVDSSTETKIFNIPSFVNQSQISDRIQKIQIRKESNTDKAILDKAILDKAILDKAILDKAILDKAILDKAILDKNSKIVFVNKPYTVPKIPGLIMPKTARIPAGTFAMGSPKSELGRAEDETIHNVTISKDFLLCIHPVTQEIWQSVMGNDFNKIEKENLPVTNVSWNDCKDFVKKFNMLTGEIYRLPTEAEWEYACRAGTDTAYSFSRNINEVNANYKTNPIPMLNPVCSCLPNALGLYDMHGNVWEWCEDWYGIYISTFQWITNLSRTPLQDPCGPIKGEKRVIRGGSFNSLPKDLRSSCRSKLPPTESYNSVGFRLVKDI